MTRKMDAEERRDEILKRLLKTPPRPHRERDDKKTKPKSKRKQEKKTPDE